MPRKDQTMSERHSKRSCPSDKVLELFCLDELDSASKKNTISDHLHDCPHCRKKCHRINSFYAILSRELDRPITPLLIDYCKSQAPRKVKYGLLVCTPLPERNSRKGNAYLATLAFSANGDGNKKRLVDFELPQDHIGVMMYSDPEKEELLLFLWNREEDNLDQWRLSIPGLFDQTVFNGIGASKIPLINIEYLNNCLVYFSNQKRRQHRKVLQKVHNILQ